MKYEDYSNDRVSVKEIRTERPADNRKFILMDDTGTACVIGGQLYAGGAAVLQRVCSAIKNATDGTLIKGSDAIVWPDVDTLPTGQPIYGYVNSPVTDRIVWFLGVNAVNGFHAPSKHAIDANYEVVKEPHKAAVPESKIAQTEVKVWAATTSLQPVLLKYEQAFLGDFMGVVLVEESATDRRVLFLPVHLSSEGNWHVYDGLALNAVFLGEFTTQLRAAHQWAIDNAYLKTDGFYYFR